MTKLVLGQQQYIRSKSVKSSDETAVKKYETNKILSMRRITDWEKNIFIPQAEKLLSTFGHSYILDAINQSCGPIPIGCDVLGTSDHFELVPTWLVTCPWSLVSVVTCPQFPANLVFLAF
jgi:hypothetical protein